MKSATKRTLSGVLTVVLALAMLFSSVSAATIFLNSGSLDESEVITFTPESDGILTITMGAADPGWSFQIIYPDGTGTLPKTGNTAGSYDYEIKADGEYQIIFQAYDKAGWTLGDGEITYDISFQAAEGEGEVVLEEYIVSDTMLYLGENDVTLETNAITTIYEFVPEETGTYRFTVAEGLLGYWGSGSFFLQDNTADKTNTLEQTVTSVGQSIMVGISGVESAVINVEKISDYQAVVTETVIYEVTHVFGDYSFNTSDLVAIDIFDDAADVAVLGNDGFYRYGGSLGPIIVVDLQNFALNLNDAYINGQLSAHVTDENGVSVKYDYNEAMMAYYNQGLYPVTEELAMMLTQIGQTRGWYIPGGFLYPDATEIDAETGWMGFCSYVQGTEIIVPTLTLNYPSLSFEDEILYNVYYAVDNATSIVEMGLITFDTRNANGTIADAVNVYPGYVNSGATYMAQTAGIPAKNLSDAVYFKVYALLSDGSYVYSDIAGYHAVAYANSVLKSSAADKAKALVVAMLNYGAAAQEYFGYKTDALMNASLTAEQQALVQAYDSSMVQNVVKADASKVGSFVMNGGYSNIFPTVSFEGAFAINFYFTPNNAVDDDLTFYFWDAATYNSVDVLTVDNATVVQPMAQDGSNWGAAVSGIAAKAIDETVYVAAIYTSNGVEYPTGIVAYSLGNYCKTLASNGNAFGAATAVYGFYAKAYFAA